MVIVGVLLILCWAFPISGCGDDYRIVGVGSPGPGILEVILKADDADSLLVIAGDTARTVEGSGDSLALSVAQGRAFRGADYAVLFKSLDEYREMTSTYNPLRKKDGTYQPLLLFKTYLPPATYDSLTFALGATSVQVGLFQIPLTSAQGAGDFVTFNRAFRIEEGRTTVLTLRFKPLASLSRLGDNFRYSWIVDAIQVTYL
jgi:hypothetical protein